MTQAAISQFACSGDRIGSAEPSELFILIFPVLLFLGYASSGQGATAYGCSCNSLEDV